MLLRAYEWQRLLYHYNNNIRLIGIRTYHKPGMYYVNTDTEKSTSESINRFYYIKEESKKKKPTTTTT